MASLNGLHFLSSQQASALTASRSRRALLFAPAQQPMHLSLSGRRHGTAILSAGFPRLLLWPVPATGQTQWRVEPHRGSTRPRLAITAAATTLARSFCAREPAHWDRHRYSVQRWPGHRIRRPHSRAPPGRFERFLPAGQSSDYSSARCRLVEIRYCTPGIRP